MDEILSQLQGNSFHLSDEIFNFLSSRYEELINIPVPEIKLRGFHPSFFRELINLHRTQFLSEEYISSRIRNPTTGTIDHIHAEITAATAVRIGTLKGISNYPLELLRSAGHLHDSDRSFPKTMIRGEEDVRHDPEAYAEYKERHAENSAVMAKHLTAAAADAGFFSPPGFITDIQYLILRHEKGGVSGNKSTIINASAVDNSVDLDMLTDFLTDSDSLSYFDTNILTNWEESDRSETALSNKVHFMYDRMTESAQNVFNETILYSENHILGITKSDNQDVNAIRSILLRECL
jgi:hypothetical protein